MRMLKVVSLLRDISTREKIKSMRAETVIVTRGVKLPRIPQLKANHRTRRKPSVAANATGLCLWAQLRASVRGAASSNVANEVPSNKKTLKHYGSMRSLLQAHASPSTSHTIELRNPVNFGFQSLRLLPDR